MKTVYACTHIEKTAEVDVYDSGVLPETATCVISQKCDIHADSLPALLKKIEDAWYIKIDDVWICEYESDGNIGRIGYKRLEDYNGDEPSDAKKREWKLGKATLYLADYSFTIEKYQVEELRLTGDEFKANGIKFHD